jgi:hypothetical protein
LRIGGPSNRVTVTGVADTALLVVKSIVVLAVVEKSRVVVIPEPIAGVVRIPDPISLPDAITLTALDTVFVLLPPGLVTVR